MVSPSKIGLLLTFQFLQSFLFYDVIEARDTNFIKFSIAMILLILSYLWSAYHLLNEHRENMYVFSLVLYTISIAALLLSKDKNAHFMASLVSFPALLLTAISKGSFHETPSVYNAHVDPSWVRLGHLLGNLATALFVYFVDPSSFIVFVIWGVWCALQLTHLHSLAWTMEKILSNVLCVSSLFLLNLYMVDKVWFGSIQETTLIGLRILAVFSTSFRCVLKIQDHCPFVAPEKGFFLFLFVLFWAIVELLVKSHLAPVQQLDFWSFFCVTLMITSLVAFVHYWDYLAYAYLYFLGLVFFYFLSIGTLWILFQGDPFQSSKILWFTPSLLIVFPLVYRFVRYE